MAQAVNLRELLIIRQHENDYIQSINANLGSAIGFKNGGGDPCIIIFVPQKIAKKWMPTSEIIKDRLEGPGGLFCPTDIVQGGKKDIFNEFGLVDAWGATPRSAPLLSRDDVIGPPPLSTPGRIKLLEELTGWTDVIRPGAQLYHDGWYGTLGCFGQDSNGNIGLITNKHVAGEVGDMLFFPQKGGVPLSRVSKVFEYLADEVRFPGIVDLPENDYRVDCAFAPLHSDRSTADIDPRVPVLNDADDVEYHELGDPVPLDLDTMGPIGQRVFAVGRTRSFQKGTIAAFAYSWYDSEWDFVDARSYTDYLIIGDEENDEQFSDSGDSGKLIVMDDTTYRPVALLWGGWKEKLRAGHRQEKWTYAIDINKILELLDVSILKHV